MCKGKLRHLGRSSASTIRFQVVALNFKGTSVALAFLGWEAKLQTPVVGATGIAVPSTSAETGGGVNFENDPCCKVMNQEAGILYQLFMQIFGCSLN